MVHRHLGTVLIGENKPRGMENCMKVQEELHNGECGWHTLGMWPSSPLGIYTCLFSLDKREQIRTLNTPCIELSLIGFFVVRFSCVHKFHHHYELDL